jgi:hypothetical protein
MEFISATVDILLAHGAWRMAHGAWSMAHVGGCRWRG